MTRPARGPQARGTRTARRTITGLLAGTTLWLATSSPALPAIADPGGTPPSNNLVQTQAAARALRLQVQALQLRAEIATQAYDAASAAMAQSTTAYLLAQQQQTALSRRAQQATDSTGRRARDLYMAGGAPALWASVLSGTSPSDVLASIATVRVLLDGDVASARAAQLAEAQAGAITQRLAVLDAVRSAAAAQAQQAASTVTGALGTAASLLDSATAQIRLLVDAEQVAAEQAAAAQARATLARLGALTGPETPGTRYATAAIAAARGVLGVPYQWGGNGPGSFDCSGLTAWAYAHAGLALPRTAAEQWFSGTPVALSGLAPGDLLFWATNLADPATIHHVALYIGQGLMIQAPQPGGVVEVSPVYLDGLIGAVRPGA